MIEKVKELNKLWEPVFPYLARFVMEFSGSNPDRMAEIGPFCGVIYEFSKRGLGKELFILAFPEGMEEVYKDDLQKRGLRNIKIIPTDPKLVGVSSEYFDFIFFRGALFFPSLFQIDLLNIYRILKKGGSALVGGGFGKDTPMAIIDSLRPRSKLLNSMLNRIEVGKEEILWILKKSGLEGNARIIEEGGIWIELRKGSP